MNRPNRFSQAITWFSAGWLILLFVAELVVGEHHPLEALVAYVPQQAFILPFVVAIVTTLCTRQVIHTAACLGMIVVFVFVFLGFHFSIPTKQTPDFRVMTVNVAGSYRPVKALVETVRREQPDILLMQEANPLRAENDALRSVESMPGAKWYTARIADVAILSRKPLSNVRSHTLIPGSDRQVLVAEIEAGGRRVTVAGVHFATNMPGASRARLWSYLQGSAKSRTVQVQDLTTMLPKNTTIIAGDCNLPPRGLAFARMTRRYADSFSAARGFGYTYPANMPLIRIDHVFASRDLVPTKWRAVGTGASDHLAVVVDMAFRP